MIVDPCPCIVLLDENGRSSIQYNNGYMVLTLLHLPRLFPLLFSSFASSSCVPIPKTRQHDPEHTTYASITQRARSQWSTTPFRGLCRSTASTECRWLFLVSVRDTRPLRLGGAHWGTGNLCRCSDRLLGQSRQHTDSCARDVQYRAIRLSCSCGSWCIGRADVGECCSDVSVNV